MLVFQHDARIILGLDIIDTLVDDESRNLEVGT